MSWDVVRDTVETLAAAWLISSQRRLFPCKPKAFTVTSLNPKPWHCGDSVPRNPKAKGDLLSDFQWEQTML